MKINITLSLAKDLITEQFPQWAHLPIKPVEVGGWDNRTFHLGTEMSIRLPSAQCYAAKVQIEQKWLPILAPHLSLRIPKPLAMGKPCKDYPFNWSIYQLIAGNILIQDNQLTAVIDFGGMAVGDPACDLVIAWIFFKNESRNIFKTHVNLDDNTWARARGWALWKALITLAPLISSPTSLEFLKQKEIIADLISITQTS